METVLIHSSHGSYRAVVGVGLLERLPRIAADAGVDPPRAVVSNTTVGPLYARAASAAAGAGAALELADGEAHKSWPAVERCCLHWLDLGLHRGDSVLALGGGVVTDTVGFAAAVYMRGIRWVAVPTTLLAMVDAAVGGKTGVNLSAGKNLIGAFWPPQLVVADVATLATLDVRELRAGLAEVVKAAWIGDQNLLELLAGLPAPATDPGPWQELVLRALRVKAAVVADDEREAGPRRALNLGHTLGHALEAATAYQRFLHGEAVAWGLRAAIALGRRRGLLGDAAATRFSSAVDRVGRLPAISDLEPGRLIELIVRDKKRDERGVAWVLPTDGGVALDQRVTPDQLLDVIRELQAAG